LAIFKYDNDLKKVVPINEVPISRNNTKNHVNMRTTWSGTTQIEFSEKSIDESVDKMNRGK